MIRKLHNIRIKELLQLCLIVVVILYAIYFVFTRFISIDTKSMTDSNEINSTIEEKSTLHNELLDRSNSYDPGTIIFSSGEQVYVTSSEHKIIVNKVSQFLHKEITYVSIYDYTLETVSHGEEDVLTFADSVSELAVRIDIKDVNVCTVESKKVWVKFD